MHDVDFDRILLTADQMDPSLSIFLLLLIHKIEETTPPDRPDHIEPSLWEDADQMATRAIPAFAASDLGRSLPDSATRRTCAAKTLYRLQRLRSAFSQPQTAE